MLTLVLSFGGLAAANLADATQAMTATTWVNMRSGPGTGNAVVKVLSPKEAVTATGKTSGTWHEVTTSDDLRGWVYGTYLTQAASSSTSTSTGKAGQMRTTANVNVRSDPSTKNPVVAVAPKGTVVPTTGVTSGKWIQVTYLKTTRWIHSDYLTASSGTSTTAPVSKGQVRTTANLYLRTGGSMSYSYTGVLPARSLVDTTGKTTADYTQIIHKGQTRWIATRYTATATAKPTTPTTPTATGTVYVTVNTLNVRSTSAADSKVVGTVKRGDALKTTGTKTSTRTQVIYQGVARWVYTPYVSTSKPGTSTSTSASTSGKTLIGISQLNANGKRVVDRVLATYPKITNIYGWRSSSDYSSDHPNGRAVDIMIPSYKTSASIDYGWAIAKDFQANAKKYNVTYIIYRQQVWNAAYPTRGWRAMENRGSDTANHYDHVHVSVSSEA